MGRGVAPPQGVGKGVGSPDTVAVGRGVGTAVGLGVAIAVGLGVTVAVAVGVKVGAEEGDTVGVGVITSVAVAVGEKSVAVVSAPGDVATFPPHDAVIRSKNIKKTQKARLIIFLAILDTLILSQKLIKCKHL